MRTVKSGKDLSKALKKASKRTGKDYSFIIQKLSIDAFKELVIRSARDTGFLRSNWSITTGTPYEDRLKGYKKGSYSDASVPNSKIEIGDKVLIYNNTEYAMYLETGTPTMRAQPMVEPTYQHVIHVAQLIIKALSKKRYNDV